MDFGEFSDVSLDTNDSTNFKSCDNSLSEIEDNSVWTKHLNFAEQSQVSWVYSLGYQSICIFYFIS